MFEDATFDSTGLKGGQTGRWSIVALGLNVAVLTGTVVVPLLWPKGLPVFVSVRELAVPAPGRVLDAQRQMSQPATASAQSIVFHQAVLAAPMIPSIHADPVSGPPTTGGDFLEGPGPGAGNLSSGVPDGTGVFAQPKPVVTAAKPGRFNVSGGVTEGLLLSKVPPAYPIIARTAGISGTVVLAASISKDGRIESLRVVSGNEMLTHAAIEAVQQWRYRPYLLNGEPVEVETTVKVVFSLGRDYGQGMGARKCRLPRGKIPGASGLSGSERRRPNCRFLDAERGAPLPFVQLATLELEFGEADRCYRLSRFQIVRGTDCVPILLNFTAEVHVKHIIILLMWRPRTSSIG